MKLIELNLKTIKKSHMFIPKEFCAIFLFIFCDKSGDNLVIIWWYFEIIYQKSQFENIIFWRLDT